MKKFLATILCIIYVAASSGATINFHYCMGKFIGFDVAAAQASCSNCGMKKEEKKGCCNDKHTTIQLKKDQLVSAINNVPNNNFVYIHHQYASSINAVLIINKDDVHSIYSPPLIQPVPGFILNCVFRI